MNPYDYGTFHFMFQCDELAIKEFIEKRKYKKNGSKIEKKKKKKK